MWMLRHKNMSMAIGIMVTATLLVLVAILPIYRNARTILGKIKTKTVELEAISNKVSVLSKLDANVLQERVDVLDAAVPPRKDILLYLSSIDGLSRELGLTFGGLSLSPGELSEASQSAKKSASAGSGLQSLDTQIKMQGGQESVYTFLRTIESVLPLMQIKDIKVSILEGDQYSLNLTLSMLWAESETMDLKGPVTLFGAEEEKYFTQLSGYRRFEQVAFPTTNEQKKQDLFAPYTIE